MTVTNNRIANNVVRGSASAGISNFNNADGFIVGNTVEGNGLRNANGNGIGVQLGPGAPPGTRMVVQGNQVQGNGWNGIQLTTGANGNQVVDNDAAGNAVDTRFPKLHGYRFYDLSDWHPTCLGNV